MTAADSRPHQQAFDAAVAAVTDASRQLLDQLVTHAPPQDRAIEGEKARVRAAARDAVSRLAPRQAAR